MLPGNKKFLFQPVQCQLLGEVGLDKKEHLVQHQVMAADRSGMELGMDAGAQRQHNKHLQDAVFKDGCAKLRFFLRQNDHFTGEIFEQHIDLAVRADGYLMERHHVEALFQVGVRIR